MELSSDLLNQFSNLTNQNKQQEALTTFLYGTISVDGDLTSVVLDGSSVLTPVVKGMDAANGDRVMVTLKNHSVTIVSNLTSPAKTGVYVDAAILRISSLEAVSVTTTYLEANYATITALNVITERVDTLEANNITASYLKANYATITNLNAAVARIDTLEANNITVSYLKANYATITNLNATNARISSLEASTVTTDYLTANFADINLANIAVGTITTAMIGIGAIETAQIADGSISDAKIVNLTATKLTAGTIDASYIEVVNLNCANLTVGSINGTQIAPGAVDMTKLSGDLSGTITKTSSDVSQALADAGLAKTAAYEATNSINNMSIGGRNLISNSNDRMMDHADYPTRVSLTQSTISVLSSGAFDAFMFVNPTIPFSEINANVGTSYTFSIEIRTTNLVTGQCFITFDFRNSPSSRTSAIGNVSNTRNGVWQKIIGTIQTTSIVYTQCVIALVMNSNTTDCTGNIFEYRNLKLEKGNKETDWTAAPEDVDATISSVQTTADGKSTVYYRPYNAPTEGTFNVDDVWFNTVDGFHMRFYNGTSWSLGQFGTSAIYAGAITTDKIYASAITAGKIAVGAVTAEKIFANAVTANAISAGAVNADKLAANAVTAVKIEAGAVTASAISAGSVTASKIDVVDLLSTGLIGANAITANNIVTGAITATKLGAGAVTANAIAANAVTADKIVANTITADKINIEDLFAQDIVASGSIISPLLKSNDYSYISGNYSAAGMIIDLKNKFIRTPNFAIDTLGKLYAANASIIGAITATSLVVYDEILIHTSYTIGEGYIKVLSIEHGDDIDKVNIYGGVTTVHISPGVSTGMVFATTIEATKLSVGGYNNASYGISCNSLICNSWIRTVGATGWYNETYGGGWYMSDSTYIRNYGGKQVRLNANLTVDANLYIGAAVSGDWGLHNQFTYGGALYDGALKVYESGGYYRCGLYNHGTSAWVARTDYRATGVIATYADAEIHGNLSVTDQVTFSSTLHVIGRIYDCVGVYNATTSSAANLYINSSGHFYRSTSSSRRYKENITNLSIDKIKSLYSLTVHNFKYKDEYMDASDERYKKDIPGFIAEEVDEVLSIAVDHINGQVEMWNNQIMVPCLLRLIQDVHQRVSVLESITQKVYDMEFKIMDMEQEIKQLKNKVA